MKIEKEKSGGRMYQSGCTSSRRPQVFLMDLLPNTSATLFSLSTQPNLKLHYAWNSVTVIVFFSSFINTGNLKCITSFHQLSEGEEEGGGRVVASLCRRLHANFFWHLKICAQMSPQVLSFLGSSIFNFIMITKNERVSYSKWQKSWFCFPLKPNRKWASIKKASEVKNSSLAVAVVQIPEHFLKRSLSSESEFHL